MAGSGGAARRRSDGAPAPATAGSRTVPLGLLRASLVILVVAHHAVLAYHPYAPRPAEPLNPATRAWSAFPVVDDAIWPGIEAFAMFNDGFFMALMFLVSGVFVWPSIARKGPRRFAGDRLRRLGIPFVVGAVLLGPLAYFPTHLLYEPTPESTTFWRRWLSLGIWPAGPVWFLWVLLVYDTGAAAAATLAPGWGRALGRATGRCAAQPVGCWAALLAVSALAYVPLAIWLDPGRWVVAGPFWVQISRMLFYAVYFVAGVGLGAYGVARGLLSPDGPLALRWWAWAIGGAAAFVALGAAQLAMLAAAGRDGAGAALGALYAIVLTVFCATVSMASLALFLRFAHRRSRVAASLDANSYGIFVLHYAFVTWLQLALLAAPLPGAAKAVLVFLGAVGLAWVVTAALRSLPAVARVL